nr:hypothetical protein [Tanacetum cinerariifolium]
MLVDHSLQAIPRTSSNQKNKVEDPPISVKFNSNKMNRVIEPVCNANVKHSMLNVNSELVCATCNECMFDEIYDLCVLDIVNDVNVRSKSKSAKSSKKKKTWKHTSKVFTNIRNRWKPIGRTFTIDGYTCPLTRITSTKVDPLRETTSKSVTTPNPKIRICRRKTKVAKSLDLSSEPSILGSMPFNILEPNKHWGSAVSKSPSSSLINFRSKDEAPKFVIKFLKMIKVRLNVTVQNIKTDNCTEVVNQTLRAYYEDVGILHQTSVAFIPQQNGVLERRNRSLVEVTRTMLIFSKASLFLWAEAIATACFIQNRSLICNRHNKTPYELLHNMLPDLSYLYVFGALCYPTNDSEDLGKLKPKADIGYFVKLADLTGTPSSNSIDQDAPSPSTSQTPQDSQSPVIPPGKTPYELLKGRKPTLDYYRVFGSKCFILNTKDYLTKFDSKSYEGVLLGNSQNSKAYIILNKHTKKIEESLNVTFDETPPPSKTSPLVDDNLDEEEAIRETEKKNLENVVEDETFKIDEIVNIKESRNHPLENVIGNLNQRTLKSQAQNQNMCDEFSKIMHDEFEMSMMGELNFFLGLQIKQMKDGIFFNQSKYIKEMLKKFGLEDSKPMKTLVSSDTKLTKDEECESVDSTKYQGMIEAPKTSHLEAVKHIFRYIKGTKHLGLWCPKGTSIETVVYADSDHARDCVDRKSTSGICTFVGCCLTSWFSKKQTTLAISTTEAEYVSIGKACQQALWMKQALIDYDVRLDDVPLMCDNEGVIDLSKNPVQHSRTKHIEIRHHFLCDNVQKGHISIEKVPFVNNIANIHTKPLKHESFNYICLGLIMMEHIS